MPLIESEEGKAYVILQVHFRRNAANAFWVTSPGVTAVGEGDEPSDALFAFCEAVKAIVDEPSSR
jgi:hypothetical protein